jgi:dTDP-4-amino-4,6-dideoxygalactose transaminase
MFARQEFAPDTGSPVLSWPDWPQYGQREADAVSQVVRSGQLFAADEVKAFEREFAQYQGSDYAFGLGNATQGLHLALAALNVGEGDEVITTPCSWISSASCILMQNAIPVFVDIEPESLGLDPAQVEKAITEQTKAIVLVHILGYPSLVKQVRDVAHKYGIPLVEDASHAPGAEVDGQKMGTFGDLGVFSLQQRKAISTGDGGVVCSDNRELAEKIRRLRSFGDPELSYNYRMTEFSGTLGRIGLEKLDGDNDQRRRAAEYLAMALEDDSWIRVRLARSHEVGVYYAVALEVNLSDEQSAKFVSLLADLGVPIRNVFAPLNRHPHFANPDVPARGYPWLSKKYHGVMGSGGYAELDLPVTYEYCYGRVLELYTHPGITDDQLDRFIAAARTAYHQTATGESGRAWEDSVI